METEPVWSLMFVYSSMQQRWAAKQRIWEGVYLCFSPADRADTPIFAGIAMLSHSLILWHIPGLHS